MYNFTPGCTGFKSGLYCSDPIQGPLYFLGKFHSLIVSSPIPFKITFIFYPSYILISHNLFRNNRGEDVVRHEPEDIDPARWLDIGELAELPEAP